jgi:two-component system, cell cycle sensor histidine kinase and response regulator CckA
MVVRILIIDDNEMDRADIKASILRGTPRKYEFHEAATAIEGLELIRCAHDSGLTLDCIILDFNLPDMGALEVLSAMPHTEGQIAVPVVVVTGNERFDEGRALVAAGAVDFVGKSWLTPESITHALYNARERHELMLRLRRSEQRYREIVETMTEGVCVTDLEGRIEFANNTFERMLHSKREELIGSSLYTHVLPADEQAFRARINGLITNSGPLRSEVRLRTNTNVEVYSSFAAMILVDGGKTRSILTIHTDITEARKLHEKLVQAQKLESLGVLAGGIAHDFNNLLVAILGHAGIALSDLRPESPVREDIAAIEVAAIRASELTKQLLAYAGRGRFVIGRLDLGRLVEEMGHLLSAVIPKNVILRYQFAAHLPAIEGDATQLRQVVMNLITNAADAIGPKKSGIITVSTSVIHAEKEYLAETYIDDTLAAGYYVCLEVSDTGSGMTAETRVKIFDPFYTTKFAGRGLGLAAVLGILRAHKGAIKVYSELNRGSTFKILLPAIDGSPDVTLESGKKTDESRTWGTILVVDDEESVRNVTRRILERAGYSVLVASDGVEALKVFREKRNEIRLIVLDVTMPHMGGEEAFRQLRLIDPKVRVILSSGYSEQEATSRFAGKGLAGFIEKPFKLQALLELIRHVLESED